MASGEQKGSEEQELLESKKCLKGIAATKEKKWSKARQLQESKNVQQLQESTDSVLDIKSKKCSENVGIAKKQKC